MTRILPLKPDVANQIAAGEVIERPASVVKELLENALDAKACQIVIEINGGGLSMIRVGDNGQGIDAEDLHLAVSAHATSKIKQLKDLYSISTKGFRGEALASIASVSKFSIASKPDYQAHAMRLDVLSKQVQQQICAREQGTTVEVRDLFFNAPVRKKFLKSEQRERQLIEFVVKRFALSAPEIALTFHSDGKTLLKLPMAGQDHLQTLRIKKLLGKQFTENSYKIQTHYKSMHLSGFVSDTAHQRSQTDKQWIYINGRMVKDKLMAHAIKQAYEDKLHPGRHPSCLIYLTIPGHEVDVNVHPAKDEVRFQEPRCVHDFVFSSISEALGTTPQPFRKQPADTLKLKENPHPYETGFVSHSIRDQGSGGGDYKVINSSFILIFCKPSPSLVDIRRLYTLWLQTRLSDTAFPLEARPLLVPIQYKLINQAQKKRFESRAGLMLEIGMQFERSADYVIVKRIPQSLPYLDIQCFIDHILNSECRDPVLNSLIVSQSIDAVNLLEDEINQLVAFWRHQDKNGKLSCCSVELNEENCRKLLANPG